LAQRVDLEREAADAIEEMATNLTLRRSHQCYFDTRIQNIDKEISASNDYYDQQIEAVEKMKDKVLLKKNVPEKKRSPKKEKQKEIVKQAIFNKVIATAEIALNLAKTLSAINLAAAELDAISFGIGNSLSCHSNSFGYWFVFSSASSSCFSNSNS
jgi:predicted NAD-dependent protein-ADP-ribosyltransferase YbiA (DUF1768 family)